MQHALQPIVTSEEMRKIEGRAFEAGMPVAALMEKAGLLMAERICFHFPPKLNPRVSVIVGSGHNGADALVVGRELLLRGYQVCVYACSEKKKALTQSHFEYLQALGATIDNSLEPLKKSSFVVDGIFGFGLETAPKGPYQAIIEKMNTCGLPVVALDIPSGLHTDKGTPLGDVAVKAALTLCLGFLKRGLTEERSLPYAGKVETLDLGLTPFLDKSSKIAALTDEWALRQIPKERPLTAHKYSMGHALIFAGSKRYPGAGILAAMGARASGLGYVTSVAGTPLNQLLLASMPDLVIIEESEFFSHLEKAQAVLIGPGLTDADPWLSDTLERCPVPVIIDAGGFRALDTHFTALKKRFAATILTPHEGEFSKLFPSLFLDYQKGLISKTEATVLAAKESKAIVVFKGARTVIASPDGKARVNIHSTPALARAGTGDVLAGFITGLVSQKLDAFEASSLAVWWHAQAALEFEKKHSPFSLSPSLLAQTMGQLLSLRHF